MTKQISTNGVAPSLLTLDQVAGMLAVSKAWVRDHATRRNPRLPVVRLGGRRALLRFRLQDVEGFIGKHLSRNGEI
jgi:helix-turn-helix protein